MIKCENENTPLVIHASSDPIPIPKKNAATNPTDETFKVGSPPRWLMMHHHPFFVNKHNALAIKKSGQTQLLAQEAETPIEKKFSG